MDHAQGTASKNTIGTGLLTGRRILVTGVATEQSIAFAVARTAQAHGASVVLSALPRDLEQVTVLAERLDAPAEAVLALDATSPDDLDGLVDAVGGPVHGALHAIAYAPKAALQSVVGVPSGEVETAFRTSVWSFAALAEAVSRLAPAEGASVVGLHFDARRAWPVYSWMGVCKAALESTNQYLARELGERRVRTNLVAAGPLVTRAASAIPGFEHLLDHWDDVAPLTWDPTDTDPVADAVCWLLSDASRATTGSIVHVDGGAAAAVGVAR